MRTDIEIIERIVELKPLDLFGYETHDLVTALPWEHARQFVVADAKDGAAWRPQARTPDAIVIRMATYMDFAIEKALEHRRNPAVRSAAHFRSWLWLLGDTELFAFADNDANFPKFGAPILKRVCESYGFPVPSETAFQRMARGLQCSEDGCEEGCNDE